MWQQLTLRISSNPCDFLFICYCTYWRSKLIYSQRHSQKRSIRFYSSPCSAARSSDGKCLRWSIIETTVGNRKSPQFLSRIRQLACDAPVGVVLLWQLGPPQFPGSANSFCSYETDDILMSYSYPRSLTAFLVTAPFNQSGLSWTHLSLKCRYLWLRFEYRRSLCGSFSRR